MAEFDNTELVDDIRQRGSLPTDDLRFTAAKLLTAASLELRDVVVPLMVETQTDRGVYVEDMAVSANQAEYLLPSRALAGRWVSVGWKADNDQAFTRMRQVSASAYYLQSDTTRATPYGFFVRDYKVVLVPTPNQGGVLRLPYYMRPNTLVATTAAATVLTVDAGANTITVDAYPPDFTSGARYDVVRATPGFETLVIGAVGTLTGVTDVTFSAVDLAAAGIAEGDYVCLAGQSPVAQCPVELRGLLATRAARRALMSVSEGTQAAMLDSSVAELTEAGRALLSPRVDAEPQEWGDLSRGLLFGVMRGIGR